MEDKYILAIESSCDETSAAVVLNGREILSNVIASQISTHEQYGGVVPEVASRMHIEAISGVVEEALLKANITLEKIDAIGVTYGPGLVGALLVGLQFAKGLAFASKKPLVGVNHIEGHICANYIQHKDLKPPFISLVVSGGHTFIVHVKDYGIYEVIGQTRDDAAGEAYDKVARALGLGYPGGPKIDKLAKEGNPKAITFPKANFHEETLDFSFSGVKSAVLNYIDTIAIAGGVASNSTLRETLINEAGKKGIKVLFPTHILCTDNAAMIGSAAYFNFINGKVNDLNLNAKPNLKL